MSKDKALKEVCKRFGIELSVFNEWALVDKGDIWVMSKETEKFPIKRGLRSGIRLIRVYKDGYKLTTAGIQLFGKFATKNIVEISPQQAKDYLAGKDIYTQASKVESGQVIVRCGNDYLGSGLYKDGKIKNQLPKGRRWY